MLVLQVIVTFLLTHQCYSYCDNPDGGCVYPRSGESDSGVECRPINYAQEGAVSWFVDPSGHLDLRFALPLENCENISCYLLELYVDESISAENCYSNTKFRGMNEILLPHSKRRYSIADTCFDGSNCECQETGLVSFNFVFTGCYQVVFHKVNVRSKLKSYSQRKYLSTNYTKELIAGPAETGSRINITSPQYYHVTETLTISFPVRHLPRSYKLHLDTAIWEIDCDNVTRECTHTTVPPNRKPVQCLVSENSVSCTFSAVKPGNYCFTMHISEDRCEPETLWTTCKESGTALTCSWQFNFTALAGSTDRRIGVGESTQKSNLTYIIVAVVFIVGVALTAIGLFALKYSGRFYPRSSSSAPPSSVIPLEPCRIFLLYARDCQPFMELMATLREVLEDATKCEVIDCLDASRWNDIGRSPVEWVRGHIEHPSTKVVLVATQCAHLRQQAHLNQTTTYYKEPGTYDSLFTYGLKTLSDNLSQDIYRKICVVRFEGFSDDGNLFNHLTPYTRFVLPVHLQKLILSLQPSVSPDQDIQLGESKEVQKLTQDLTNLINYKNKNINYLQNLLIVQRNNVNLT